MAQRIQSVLYDPNQAVTLSIAEGYALVVELPDEERIDNIIVGDSGVWQVTTNKRGSRVVIKPLAGAAPTNLIVATDQRAYVFVLRAGADPSSMPFLVRFVDPQSVALTPAVVRTAAEYKLRGSRTLFPVLMTDDGQRTSIRWNRGAPLPAIVAINEQREEAIVNGRMINGDYVIEGVAQRYVFRRDKAQAVATRQPVRTGAR